MALHPFAQHSVAKRMERLFFGMDKLLFSTRARGRFAMNKSTYGEELFRAYLTAQQIAFEYEPNLPGVSQRIDFVVDHRTCGKVLLEVKDVVNPLPPRGGSVFDPYKPIREHIEEGTRKFRSTADYVCALVLAAPPSSFVQLDDPTAMLGAMYGDLGFRIPLYVGPGLPPSRDDEGIRSEFLVGNGKMVRRSRLQNTRIAALITIHAFKVWHLEMRKFLNTDDGRTPDERVQDIYDGIAGLPEDIEATEIGVTVWENAAAAKKLPTNLFRGEMDAWWEALPSGEQKLTFVGDRRRELRVDVRR